MCVCVQVWISYAQFEMSIEGAERLQRCRQVYEEANRSLRMCEEKEERLMLLEAWKNFEQEFGTSANKDRVRKLLPEKVKKRKKLTAEDGVSRTSLQRISTECGMLMLHTSTSQRSNCSLHIGEYFLTACVWTVLFFICLTLNVVVGT